MTDKQKDEPTLKEKCMNSGKIAFPESAERATRCGNAVYGAVVYQLRTKDEEPSGPYIVVIWGPTGQKYIKDGNRKIVDMSVICDLLNAKPEPVEGLQELADLWRWADAVLDGFCGGEQTPEITRKYKIRREAFNDFRKTLTALGVNLG